MGKSLDHQRWSHDSQGHRAGRPIRKHGRQADPGGRQQDPGQCRRRNINRLHPCPEPMSSRPEEHGIRIEPSGAEGRIRSRNRDRSRFPEGQSSAGRDQRDDQAGRHHSLQQRRGDWDPDRRGSGCRRKGGRHHRRGGQVDRDLAERSRGYGIQQGVHEPLHDH